MKITTTLERIMALAGSDLFRKLLDTTSKNYAAVYDIYRVLSVIQEEAQKINSLLIKLDDTFYDYTEVIDENGNKTKSKEFRKSEIAEWRKAREDLLLPTAEFVFDFLLDINKISEIGVELKSSDFFLLMPFLDTEKLNIYLEKETLVKDNNSSQN